jgi:hypothetical protein
MDLIDGEPICARASENPLPPRRPANRMPSFVLLAKVLTKGRAMYGAGLREVRSHFELEGARVLTAS